MKAFFPCAVTLATVLLPTFARADNLLKNASFELPKIEGRVGSRNGGDPSLLESDTSWAHFHAMDKAGKLTVGLTTEVSHTGKQAIYVRFDRAMAGRGAFLMTELLPIKSEEPYHVSLWGRLDRKTPLTLDQGRPYMQVEAEFYAPDQATTLGDAAVRTQMIPGSAKRLMFLAGRWTEYFADFKAPAGAIFMKLTFRWESPKDAVATGVVYFDDAVVEGVAGTVLPVDPPETDTDEPSAEAPASATPAGAAPREAAPAAPTKKK